MATYAIGDIQGCYSQFRALLKQIRFDPSEDRLWLAGDLINRGPESLETLRYVKSLGDRAVYVLGNHECHFLAVARGHKAAGQFDTFDDILKAPDADELVDWIRHWPFYIFDDELGYGMLHAGVPPQWTPQRIEQCARELEAALQGPDYDTFLADMYGNKPKRWKETLSGQARLRFIINCFTRMRFCKANGKLNLKHNGPPGSQPDSLMPWFKVPGRLSEGLPLVFGHWSQLGYYRLGETVCLDSGCLWGGHLTALQLESKRVHKLDCDGYLNPIPK